MQSDSFAKSDNAKDKKREAKRKQMVTGAEDPKRLAACQGNPT